MPKFINPRVLYTVMSGAIIIIGTLVAIQYAKGNFRLTREGFVPSSGLLAANSFPPGAEIYVDDKLVSATDDTLYLEPGEYTVRIEKEGYLPWEKQLQLKQELVTQTNAVLFPQVPSLSPLTFTGVQNIKPSPDGQKLVYYSASNSATTKNGLYVLELTNSFLSLQRGARQVTNDLETVSLDQADLLWSPDSSEVLILDQNQELLVDVSKNQDLATLTDVSFRRKTILSTWEEEMYLRERQFLDEFPDEILHIATQSAKNVYLSPDKKRLLYTATENVTIPNELVPPPPSTNTQTESRELEVGSIYVYDREEDRNFKVGQEELDNLETVPIESQDYPLPLAVDKMLLATDLFSKQPLTLDGSPSAFTKLQATSSALTAMNFSTYHSSLYAKTFQWFPDSKHLIYTTENQIHIMEYDGTNDQVVFSGPFTEDFIYPWPDGSKLVIMTTFSPHSPMNLYAIELK